jgi:hypothetical protein
MTCRMLEATFWPAYSVHLLLGLDCIFTNTVSSRQSCLGMAERRIDEKFKIFHWVYVGGEKCMRNFGWKF